MLKVKTCFSLLITLYVSHTLTLRYLLYLGVFRLLASKILKNKLDVTKFNFPVAGTDRRKETLYHSNKKMETGVEEREIEIGKSTLGSNNLVFFSIFQQPIFCSSKMQGNPDDQDQSIPAIWQQNNESQLRVYQTSQMHLEKGWVFSHSLDSEDMDPSFIKLRR
ncbi:unnamed protein product [Lactuca saligna]|uniref:Uncharacterized protein n=1 Tax=Lactuca saligna TaxID=75948 RepID=A0AA35Z5D4_LACSI|nr:unnamed protein product [Lactuca saligna]